LANLKKSQYQKITVTGLPDSENCMILG